MSVRVASGRIKVDARRALEKLREHLLVDLHLYALEIVRSAIASGATAIDLRYDADDVELTWDGDPFEPAALSRLLDHVLGEGHTRDGRRLRLLALGVNAALGLKPEYVDLYATDEAGVATRTRWTAALLDPDARDSGRADVIEIAPPAPMAPRRTRVHVKRRLGLAVLRRVLGELPREIVFLADATHDLGALLRANGDPFERAPRPRALLRAAIEIRETRRAVVEILPVGGAVGIEWLEQGVCLLRSQRAPFASPFIPARIVVDAEELPTNASRSALREDAAILRLVASAAEIALIDLESALIARVMREGITDAHGVEVLEASDAELEDALGAFVVAAAVAMLRGDALAPRQERLLDLPLLRDGAGAPRTARSVIERDRSGMPLWVWSGAAPVDAELAPWMHDVIWLRGRAVEHFVRGLSSVDAAPLLELAKAGLDRKKRVLAHAPGPPILPPSSRHVAKERFAIHDGDFAGLEGEVALVAVPPLESSLVRIFVSQRAIATITIPRATLPLALEIAIAWDQRLTVLFDWSGVETDITFRAAVWRASRVGVALASLVAEKLDAMTPLERQRARPMLRAALGASVVSRSALGLAAAAPEILANAFPALWNAKVWPTTELGCFVSLAEIWSYAAKARAICVAIPDARGVAADGRPVLAIDVTETLWVRAALGGEIPNVPYTSGLVRGEPEQRRLRRVNAVRAALRTELGDPETCASSGTIAAMIFERPGRIGFIGVSAVPALIELHAEHRLSRVPMKPRFGAVVIAVDDDDTVPDPTWSFILRPPDPTRLQGIEREFCEAIVLSLEGDRSVRARFGPLMPADPGGVRGVLLAYLLDSATALRGPIGKGEISARDRALLDRIEALPILDVLDASRIATKASLSSLRNHSVMGEVLPRIAVLECAPSFDTLDWRPVVMPNELELQALVRWSSGSAVRADAEIPERRQRAADESALRAHLAKPAIDPRSPGDRADPNAASSFLAASDTEPSVAIGLPRTVGDAGLVEVLVEGRNVCEIAPGLPVVARVEGGRAYLDVQLSGGKRAAIVNAVKTRVAHAAIALCAARVFNASKNIEATVHELWDGRVVALLVALLRRTGGDAAEQSARRDLEVALKKHVLWPTAQGGAASLATLRKTDDDLCIGFERYASWCGPSRGRAELDFPILWVPRDASGDGALALVRALGFTPRDVTEGLAKLQAHRSNKGVRAPARLTGAPAFPALRVAFESLGTVAGEGELEIIEAGPSDVQILDIDGVARRIDASFPIPIRFIATIEIVELTRDATTRLANAATARAKQLLRFLGPRLDELPDFARTHLRRIVCEELEITHLPNETDRFAVFADLAGGFHSLAEIAGDRSGGQPSRWPWTSDPPPYPRAVVGAGILRLNEIEAKAIVGAGIALDDVSMWIREARFGEARASAAPLEALELDASQRSKCLWTTRIDGAVSGEIGVLAPASVGARGILLHTTRRPLCLVDDAPGWPLLAVVNDDRARPNATFDGLSVQADGALVSAAVRAIGDERWHNAMGVPADALASRFVNETLETSAGKVLVVGALWIPAVWPASPQVFVRTPSAEVRTALVTFQKQSGLLAGTIAIEGQLLVAPSDGALGGSHGAAIADLGLRVLVDLVDGARVSKHPFDVLETPAASEALEAYAASLALLDRGDARFPIAGGGTVGQREIFAEIAARGVVWWSDKGGDVEGRFPGVPPAFVLIASPALDVLRARLAAAARRELGGLSERSAAAVAVAPEGLRADPPSVPGDAPEANHSGILDRIRTAFGALFATEEEQSPPSAPSLRQALFFAIDRLQLTGTPVVAVKYSKRGRPLHYEKSTKTILLNRDHSVFAGRVIASGPGLAMLVAAAVAEVNRELTEVTDAEEARALRSMIAESS